jgi:hypothetical protein
MIYLTKKQLEEIAKQIASISVKDSDFEETEEINDDDFVAIVQNGVNKRILIETLRDGIARGEKGDPGESAYELAVDEGYEGTLDQWLASLKGEPGEDGAPGTDGAPGVGVPVGGTTGQVLAKSSNSDYATTWVNQSGGGASVGSLNTTATTAQETNASESMGNNITLHKISKTGNLGDLTNVTISSVSSGQVLSYNGTGWVNSTPGSGGNMNYVRMTASEYNTASQGGTLLPNTLYVIVDTYESHIA